jgi:putative transposase
MKKIVIKTFKYRIYPKKEQQVFLIKHFGCCRFVYNYFLNQRKSYYLNNKKEKKKTLNYYDNAKQLIIIKGTEEFKWLKEVNSQSILQSLKYLDSAYIKFFKKKAMFPQFKSKRDKQSFAIPQSFKVKENKLFIPKLKSGIEIVLHRPLTGKMLFATISKNPCNQYFVSITCETEYEVLPQNGNTVGLDLGIKDLVITSDGKKYENLKVYQKYEKKLKFNQRQISKKRKEAAQEKNRYLSWPESITKSRIFGKTIYIK